jgi:von Willebrand factor type A domain-containing protein
MHLAFLTPLAAVAIVVVVVPLLSVLAARSRDARARRGLGLPRPSVGAQVAVPAAIVLALVLAGVAAAQPVIEHGVPRRARTDAQVYVLFDISRSMAAAPAPHALNRLARAKQFAEALRGRLSSVPVGVATFTDRVLPLEFPTADPSSFASVARTAVAIDQPAPQRFYADRATSLDSLAQFVEEDYFDSSVRHRVVVVLTDGESQPVSPSLADTLRRAPGVHVVFVHVARGGDKLWTTGLPDPNYRADPSSGAFLQRVAGSLHGTAVADGDVSGAASAVRASLGAGPVQTVTEPARLALMPYVTLAAFVPLAFVLWRRNA